MSQDTVTLRQKDIYVLPNRQGGLLLVVLLVMLLASLNYNLSLGFAFTFLLAGVVLVSIFHTYRNLQGLTLTVGTPEPVFAGTWAVFPLALDNRHGPPRWGIRVFLADDHAPMPSQDIPAASLVWCHPRQPALRRGWLTARPFRIETTHPLGVIRGWSVCPISATCLVYPPPATQAPPLPRTGQADGWEGMGTSEGDDFQGLRPFHPGDSARHVHWKTLARGNDLLVKQFGGQAQPELWLDFDTLLEEDVEERLSLLCRWVLEAHDLGLSWGLKLPDRILAMGHGENHRQACLQALALYPAQNRG